MTTGQPASDFRYWAFISYSHKDASWGRWLHKALETYRVPRRLVGMPIAAGKVPARLSPVFRDRDELPTTNDLGAAVEEALGQSWCLIVICSPESAQSRWVNEEVLAFQRLGRGDRIHCLIVDGGPDPAAPLCFPPSLEQAQPKNGNGKSEPVAADARRFGDGRSHALLKLIAGVLGIRYDTLVQRDQQRKHRNLFWITCASLALVVVLAVATLVAVTSRREAVDQRSHAEGLVEFMIGDLRKKLEPDGKLATLDAVGKEALAYYAAQKSEDLDADGLARRSRALHMIGEVYDLRGELDEALKVFEQAADSTKELVEREPGNGQRVFDHAQSVYWVGYIAYQRGDIAIAEPAFQEYKQLAERLVAIDPGNDDWQAEVGFANSNLGTLLYQQRRLDEASSVFRTELDSSRAQLSSAGSNLPRLLRVAQAHAWLSDVEFMQGKLRDAVEDRQAEIHIYEDVLKENINNNEAREALSVAERSLARIIFILGDTPAATMNFERAAELANELVKLDPENTSWRELSATADEGLAGALVESGDMGRALEAINSATDTALLLLKADPTVVAWNLLLSRLILQRAQLAGREGAPAEALQLAQDAIHRLEAIPPSSLHEHQITLLRARGLQVVAEESLRMNKVVDSESAWEDILTFLSKENDNSDPGAQAVLAVSYCALGRLKEAQVHTRYLENIGYREPTYLRSVTREKCDLPLVTNLHHKTGRRTA